MDKKLAIVALYAEHASYGTRFVTHALRVGEAGERDSDGSGQLIHACMAYVRVRAHFIQVELKTSEFEQPT